MMERCLTQTVSMSETSTKTAAKTETLSTFATLNFSGDALEPQKVTDILGVEPTNGYRKGEVYLRSRGREAHGRTGLWHLRTMRCVNSTNLADYLRYIVGVLCPEGGPDHLAALRDLMRRYDLEADVSCFWYGSAGARPPPIPTAVKEVFDRLGATIETDFATD
jgi:hypothetical protein